MINQYCSNNVASTSDAESAAANSLLIKYANKSVELKIMQDVISMYENNFLEKEKILEEEKRKLEELNYQVWSLEDSFCEQVWQFSKEHDFSAIFKQYPFVMQINCAKQKVNNNHEDDMEKCFELIDLIKEIDVIQIEICNLNRKNVKYEVENALMHLQKLQITSEEIKELLNLISPSELCKLTAISIPMHNEIIPDSENKVRRRKNNSNCEDLKIKKTRGSQNKSGKNKSCLKNGKPKRKVAIAASSNYSQLPIERSIIFTAEKNKPQVDVKLINNETEKLKNFTPKKRSEISVKFEQNREHE